MQEQRLRRRPTQPKPNLSRTASGRVRSRSPEAQETKGETMKLRSWMPRWLYWFLLRGEERREYRRILGCLKAVERNMK